MVGLDDHSFVMVSSSDHSPTSLVPGSVDVFELMWVDPWFKFVLVLLVRWVVDGRRARGKQSILRR